jgi:hypothetical protein
MPAINGSMLSEISKTKIVKELILMGTTILAKNILQESSKPNGGTYNLKTYAKRQILARKILNMELQEDSDFIMTTFARLIMEIQPEYFLFVVDLNDVINTIDTNNLWNIVANVTGDDLI